MEKNTAAKMEINSFIYLVLSITCEAWRHFFGTACTRFYLLLLFLYQTTRRFIRRVINFKTQTS